MTKICIYLIYLDLAANDDDFCLERLPFPFPFPLKCRRPTNSSTTSTSSSDVDTRSTTSTSFMVGTPMPRLVDGIGS